MRVKIHEDVYEVLSNLVLYGSLKGVTILSVDFVLVPCRLNGRPHVSHLSRTSSSISVATTSCDTESTGYEAGRGYFHQLTDSCEPWTRLLSRGVSADYVRSFLMGSLDHGSAVVSVST